MNKPVLYYQYNPELKETSYSINYVFSSKKIKNIPIPEQPDQDNKISYYLKYQENEINDTPGLFIFLIDQSGSMSGKSIELVKKSLLLFIQSLPAKSYFQLIGFGSDYIKYNSEPVEYNQENVKNIINIINGLKADMGGTNISQPLNCIYKDENYSKINLSKNIFILTDGQVFDKRECFNLITLNSNKFRIHSIGIGSDFDKDLIEQSGKLGKGSSRFVENVENINSAVIDILNKCLREYLTDLQFNFQNYQDNISNSIIECLPINNFTYQDEIMNYSFILDEKHKIDIDNISKSINIEISCKDPINIIKQNISFINNKNIIKLKNGDEMSKMIVGKGLKNNKEFKEDENKEIKFAKKYQILSKNTALFVEMKNNGDNQQSKLIKVNLNDDKYRNNNSLNNNYCRNNYSNIFHQNNYIGSRGIYGLHRCNVYGSPATVNICLKNDHEENMRLIGNDFMIERQKEKNRHIELEKERIELDSYNLKDRIELCHVETCKMRDKRELKNLESCKRNDYRELTHMETLKKTDNKELIKMESCKRNDHDNELKMKLLKENAPREIMKMESYIVGYPITLNAIENQRKSESENCLKSIQSLNKIELEKNRDIEKLKFENEMKKLENNHEIDLKKYILSPINNEISNNNNQIEENIINLIICQDIIEGFWNENKETKQLINIMNKEYNSINKKVKDLNKGGEEIKIVYTILVIHYLTTKYPDKIKDYRLVINKAKKFLDGQGINYDDFIKGI